MINDKPYRVIFDETFKPVARIGIGYQNFKNLRNQTLLITPLLPKFTESNVLDIVKSLHPEIEALRRFVEAEPSIVYHRDRTLPLRVQNLYCAAGLNPYCSYDGYAPSPDDRDFEVTRSFGLHANDRSPEEILADTQPSRSIPRRIMSFHTFG